MMLKISDNIPQFYIIDLFNTSIGMQGSHAGADLQSVPQKT
jgi:hypothetical protein